MDIVHFQRSITSVLGKPLSAEGLIDLNGRILLEVLTTMGARCAVVSYSGEGDEGNINDVTVEPADLDLQVEIAMLHETAIYQQTSGWCTHQDFKPMPIEEALTAFADRMIDVHHSGYENNDGGRGEVTFDCAAGTIILDHHDYYVESHQTVTVL